MTLSAIKRFAQCTIIFTARGRVKTGFGGLATDALPDSTCTFTAYVSQKELEKLSVGSVDSYGSEQLKVYLIGQVNVKLNDTALFDGETYKVSKARYRSQGGFTKVVIDKITRRAFTA